VGLHGQLTRDLNIALVYHSALHFNLQGDSTISNTPITGANVSGLPGFIAVAPQLPAISKATGKLAANSLLTEASQLALTTPANLSFSADYQLNSAWSWQNTISWTGWSKFRSIDIQSRAEQATISLSTQQSQNLNQPGYIGYIPEYWQDSWSFATGLSWAFSSTTMLKTGLAYDGNPISQSHRTARVPTSDRVWWTLGLNQQLSHTMSLDVAAGWMWMDDVQIKEREYNVQNQPLYKSGLQGRFDNMAYVLSAQLNYWF
jgi:long-chain fatty acid transport protein